MGSASSSSSPPSECCSQLPSLTYIINDKPYVILIGAVGSGKTTLTEKLTGLRNLGVKNFGSSANRVSTIYPMDESTIYPIRVLVV